MSENRQQDYKVGADRALMMRTKTTRQYSTSIHSAVWDCNQILVVHSSNLVSTPPDDLSMVGGAFDTLYVVLI